MTERRRVIGLLLAVALLAACGERAPADTRTTVDSARDSVVPEVVAPRPPMILDTLGAHLLEVWPVAVSRGRQADEVRRLVEHLQADLALVPGFATATLLASGDGSSLVLMVAWDDSVAAAQGDVMLAGWLRLPADTALRRRTDGTLTRRVWARRTTGSPPVLTEGAMLQFTRYVMKPGHSFGALAVLADSSLAMRVLQDTAAQGGALLAAADSGAIYMVLQARNATALGPGFPAPSSSLPFWAPFAVREEQLLAVVAIVQRRPGGASAR
ncbi:MAG: hypothetical protein V4813_05565 [Gemmatimonadota bacterium]